MTAPAAAIPTVAIDVGTSKVAVLIGQTTPEGQMQVIGYGCKPAKGMKRGTVLNIESVAESIARAVQAAEHMANYKIHSGKVSLTGQHIQCVNSQGVASIRNREINESDLQQVMETASALVLPSERMMLHVISQDYVVDGQEGVAEPPIGMSAMRLEGKVHIVTSLRAVNANLEKCIDRCDLQSESLIFSPIASADVVLTLDERELGVALIDIGAGTTDLVIMKGGAPRHSAVIPVGGDLITNDIAMGLRTPTPHAEYIKTHYGCALTELLDSDEVFEVMGIGNTTKHLVSRYNLCDIIRARCEELLSFVAGELQKSGLAEALPAGIVITGGGALLPGIRELAEAALRMPVRLALMKNVEGLPESLQSPIFAAGYSLLLYGQKENPNLAPTQELPAWLRTVKTWFKDLKDSM
jgi:cell division protein FtsA